MSFRGIQGEGRRGSRPLMLLAQLANEEPKQRVSSNISAQLDLLIELGPIPAPGLPTFEDVRLVRIKDASAIRGPVALGEGLRFQKARDGVTRQLHSERTDWSD